MKEKIKEILAVIIVIFVVTGTVWASFTYLERYALCASVDKQFEMIEQKQKKQMEKIDQDIKQDKVLFQYELKKLELKQIEEQIYQMEKNFGAMPKDPIKRAELERLKRQREELLIEQRILKEKK
jgi:hypothetical protein